VLYELILSKEIQNSSLSELFLDLLFSAIKADLYDVRVKAFVKRIVSNALHADQPFIISCLVLISRLIPHQKGIRTMLQSQMIQEDEDEKS